MGKLMQAIRQRTCRHKHVNGGGWVYDSANQEWGIIGICDRCGYKVFELRISDKSIENMHEEMQEEKRGEAGNHDIRKYGQ